MGARVVRAARLEDAAEMAAAHVASWRETYAHIVSPEFLAALDADARAEMWRGAITRFPGHVFVAEADGDIVGLAAATPADEGPRALQLNTIYLLAAHQGSGLGQALLDAAVQDRPAFLWVAENNPRARAFYARNGFAPDGARASIPEWEDLVEVRMVR
ncbi:MAG: N-acetyltransferase family protein [Actinomycetes bacterium]